MLPVETASGEIAADRMLISCARATSLKLSNQSAAAVPQAPVLICTAEPVSLLRAMAIADPSADLAHPLKGPFKALSCEWGEEARVALELARIAGILPAFLVDAEPHHEPVTLEVGDLAAWQDSTDLAIATRARLPVEAYDNAEIVAFRSPHDLREHVALIVGTRSETVPLVRLHSECLTGDILGSLKCDCGPQLDAALQAMAEEARTGTGWGVLLYMRQEGRGIGLINKMRAYRLQDQGFDTVDANNRLGLPDEARDFAIAARMLELLGIPAIRLMTNNPRKVDALTKAGAIVTERVPHQLPDNPHNARYLATKRDRAGHLLD